MNLRDSAAEFRTALWRTAGARFHAWRRLKNRNTLSAFTISTVSVYLIGISLYQKIYEVGATSPELDNNLTYVAILGAVFIIVLSLIDWASDFSINAAKMFDNATKIKALQGQIGEALIDGVSNEVLAADYKRIRSEYSGLTAGDSPNHEPVDDFLFRAQNKAEPSAVFQIGWPLRVWARIWWFSYSYGLYLLIVFVPIIAICRL